MRWTSVTDRAGGAVALLACLVLSSCGSPADEPDLARPTESVPLVPVPTFRAPTEPDAPERTVEVPPPPPPVRWDEDGDQLAVTTWGSSSCPRGPTDVAVARTTEVGVRGGVSADEPLTVHLRHGDGEEETVVVPPAGE
jgi:hypothetical protein